VTGRGARRAFLRGGIRERRSSGWTSTVVILGALAAAVSVAVGPASADPSITSKRAQAQAILAQVQELDADLGQTIESWNYANIELDRIDDELDTNARHLVTAKKSLVVAQVRISTRLRDLYVNGSGDSTLEVLLGARSLDEVVDRLDAIQRVSHQDTTILASVKRFKKEVESRRTQLRDAREDQARIVAERAAQKEAIEGRLAERQRLLASVKDEIARLQAEERARQARLAAEARERLRAQRLALLQAQNEAVAPSYESDAVIPSAPPPDGDLASQMIGIAMQYLGVPYVWGGASPSEGFDCSGLVTYVYAQIGVSLPHHAASQYNYGTPVSREELQPADLVFFNGLGHMGMYIGGGQFIHAPHTGDVVKISSIYEGWYASSYVGARRIL
jgi:cell wall-associated NlpC family hydrolase